MIKQLIRPLLIIGIIIFSLLLGGSFLWMRYEAKTACWEAKKKYPGDCIDALSFVLQDNNAEYSKRNRAIWVLGQRADKRALPVLKKYYTGVIPSREPLDKTISQYELRKAIKWCEEGNITSWMYGEQ